MAGVWSSSRLIYRALEPQDDAFINEFLADPETLLNGANFLPKPVGSADASLFREFLTKNCMLGCVICLAPAAAGSNSNAPEKADETDASSKKEEGEMKKKTQQPIPIGTISLTGCDARVAHHRQSHMGIYVAKKYQGQGYGTEAIKWCFRWGFRFAGLHRIGVSAFAYNTGAVRLYRRMGLVEEGIKRECLWFDGKYWDMVDFGILEHEWREKFEKTG